MRYTDYVVEYQLETRGGRVKLVRKSFKTEDARAKFLDKLEESDNFVKVLRFSDPQ